MNGGKHFRSIAFKHQSMNDWLLDAPKILSESESKSCKLVIYCIVYVLINDLLVMFCLSICMV